MSSLSLARFTTKIVGANILRGQVGEPSKASPDQVIIDQTMCMAAVALGVGCWEGYVEGVLKEFVSRIRVQAQRRSWTLIAQFEALVDKMTSNLNTPNWDRTRELLMEIAGIDPYSAWVWTPRYLNPNDTKLYLDGIMHVRHAFAHGFDIPRSVLGLSASGLIDGAYVDDALECILFFATKTDELLTHELRIRHSCPDAWT